jgi:hypothetical protein
LRRHTDLAGRAVEQIKAKLLFKALQLHRDRRLREVQNARSLFNAACIRDGHKTPQRCHVQISCHITNLDVF